MRARTLLDFVQLPWPGPQILINVFLLLLLANIDRDLNFSSLSGYMPGSGEEFVVFIAYAFQ